MHPTEIQVAGLGLGRTGTTSVAMALMIHDTILGFSVIHDDEQPELTEADLYV